jgi:hypothetical protein
LKLHHVDTPFARFASADHILADSEQLGELRLTQFGSHPQVSELFQKDRVLLGV